MNIVRLRNGKIRLLAGVCIALLVLGVIYVALDEHTKFTKTKSKVQDCEHRHESLSAQLQVIIEHRSRLEKSVQLEKFAHKQTKDKLESMYEELQELHEKSKQESQAKYSALQQQYKTLQRQQDELHKEFSKLQQINAELQEEKTNIINKMSSEMEQLRMAKDTKSVQLQAAITRLEHEKEEMITKLDQSSLISQLQSDLVACKTQLKSTAFSNVPINFSNTKTVIKTVNEEPAPVNPVAADIKPVNNPVVNSNMQYSIDTKNGDNILIKDIKNSPLEIEEKNNIPEINDKSIQNNRVPQQPLAQEDSNKNSRQIPPPLSNIDNNNIGNNNNGHNYLQDNEVNGADDIRQVEEPVAQNKADIDQKNVAHQSFNRQAMVVHDQIDGKGLDMARDPINAANGLDQQENDEDQDLDNMENEVEDKKNGNQFDGADFDQADQDDTNGNRNNNDVAVKQHDSVVAHPR